MDQEVAIFIESVKQKDLAIMTHDMFTITTLAGKGFKLPHAFIITDVAFKLFLKASGLLKQFNNLVSKAADGMDFDAELKEFSENLLKSEIPREVAEALREAYTKLGSRSGSFPPATFLYASVSVEGSSITLGSSRWAEKIVVSPDALLEEVRKMWSRVVSQAVIAELAKSSGTVDKFKVSIFAACIPPVKASGRSEVTDNQILVQSTLGLYMPILDFISFDEFIIDKSSMVVLEEKLSPKEKALTIYGGVPRVESVLSTLINRPSLTPEEAIEAANLALRLSELVGKPVSVVWLLSERPKALYVLAYEEVAMGHEIFVIPFEKLRKEDSRLAGGKNANLGELAAAGFPVPPGFAITSKAYEYFLEKSSVKERIAKMLEETPRGAAAPEAYQEASKRIREVVEAAEVPPELRDAIVLAYRELCRRLGREVYVAVRSSATAEDLSTASFAGQQETYLNIRGEEELIRAVKKCWSSLFTARAIFYREQKGFPHEQVLMGVGVQEMVDAKSAGVMFTIDPVTGDPTKLVIESSWGLGESVVSGEVTPDYFVVDKKTLKILERKTSRKEKQRIRDPETGRTVTVEVPDEKKEAPSLTDDEVRELAQLGIKIEKHYGQPQDIEWAIDRNRPFPHNVMILQARPETVWSAKRLEEAEKPPEKPAIEGRVVVVKGLPASPGVHTGRAKVALTVEEASKIVSKGDILVTKMTNPDWVPYMRLAGAIVTDEGGMTCHAAIVSRELGIPCIVGAGDATQLLKTGEVYTVDASAGVVYEGVVEEVLEKPSEEVALPRLPAEAAPITGTKIYMNLGAPDMIDKYKNLPFDGIGLMRIEFILASYIGDHPNYLIEIGHPEKFVDKLADGITRVARAIYPRPVVVRFSDFKTNEYRQLKGGEKYEPEESNPMLGWRGASRYISPGYEKAFRLECKAIRKVREEYGLKNVWVMIPFVRTVWELQKCLEIMAEEGLRRGRDFKIWIMAEVPSIIILADEFSKYVDGFSIGSNDLTQLILGVDRDSQILPEIDSRYFDERDPAVKRAIHHLIEVAHENGVTVSICGQAPSVYPDFVEFLVRCGIDSISVNPDAVIDTRRLVASIEQRILLEQAVNSAKSRARLFKKPA